MEEYTCFKFFLSFDNVPICPAAIIDLHPNSKVVFLLPYTSSLTYTMAGGVMVAFKDYNLRRTFVQDNIATEENIDYNIYCIEQSPWGCCDATKLCMSNDT
jgi:hypothetical protein